MPQKARTPRPSGTIDAMPELAPVARAKRKTARQPEFGMPELLGFWMALIWLSRLTAQSSFCWSPASVAAACATARPRGASSGTPEVERARPDLRLVQSPNGRDHFFIEAL